jgi:NADH:ubiquinone oxidoreductase subunit 6 (subunit J)
MHRYTIFFITFNALHVSGGFSAHHLELKNCTHSILYMSSLLAATASVGTLGRVVWGKYGRAR